MTEWCNSQVLLGGLLILGDHLFLNYIFFGQRGLINTAGIINPNLTLLCLYFSHWWDQNTDVSHHGNFSFAALSILDNCERNDLVNPRIESIQTIPNFAGNGYYITIENRGFTLGFTTLREYTYYIYNVVSLVYCFKKKLLFVWPGTEIICELKWSIPRESPVDLAYTPSFIHIYWLY